MVKIKINLPYGELTIEFSDTKDFENQLERIDLKKLHALLEEKKQMCQDWEDCQYNPGTNPSKVDDLGTINLLKVSEAGQDALKLAVFLASNGVGHNEIKKITGVTILS